MSKIYFSVLNEMLSKWAAVNNVLIDKQNGLRMGSSTTNQLSSFINVDETRLKYKQSTFLAFIDFKKRMIIYKEASFDVN